MQGTTKTILLCGWVCAVACSDSTAPDESKTTELEAEDDTQDGDGSGDIDEDGDGDGDGFAADEDCDDTRADVNPSAVEVCDGIDNDCDGAIDPSSSADASEWFFDGDGDGFGHAAISERSCTPPVDHVDNSDDCDDTDAEVHPEATEVCDAGDTDEDCNGFADDDDSGVDATTTTRWHIDGDGDGFGDEADAGSLFCDDPSTASTDYVTDTSDCNDSDEAINPAATEVCDASDIDEDCSGLADDEDPGADIAATGTEYYLDADSDGYGDSRIPASVYCDDPSTASTDYVTDATDCDDSDDAVHPGATELCNGVDD
ncbi:MAG TPA: hypothetical protein DFR83_06500, partial [Deltaproteobacteria bacterium]|nr:hypothetical protein [Deltaproteobacteria bacterium]